MMCSLLVTAMAGFMAGSTSVAEVSGKLGFPGPEAPEPEASAPAVPEATPESVVPYRKLLPFLPEPPPGWGAERPDGSTTETGEIHMSTVRRTYYRKGDAENLPVAVVSIIDAASNADLFGKDGEAWPNNSESEDGFDRRVMIEGMRGLEHYSKKAKTGSLSVYVGSRYFVQIELTNEDPTALRDWLKRLDLEGLSELK